MAQDGNSRKDLYRSLINSKDKDARETFNKLSFPDFEKRLLADKDLQGEIAGFLREQGTIKDLYDFHDKYLIVSKVAPQPQPQSQPVSQPQQQPQPQPVSQPQPESLLDITRKQIRTPMAPEQLPFKQVGVLASDKGPDLGETKPTYVPEAMGLAFNPMIQSAIKVVKGFFSKDTGIKDNKTPHFDWSPLANYEQAQTKHREADKEFQKLESESKRHGAGAGYGEYDAGTHLKLSKEIPVLKSKAEKSLLEASPTIDKIIEDSYKNADKTKFMDFNPSTKKNIVSLDKIQNLSRQIAKQAGLPETGYAQQRIATQMKAYVEHKQIEPAVEKEVYKILGNQTPQDIGKKDFEGYVKANSKIEGVKTQADIAQQTVASQINKEAKTAASQHKTQYKLLIADLNKRLASDPEIAEEANQIHGHYQQLVNEGKMPLETAQAESKAALNEFAQKKYGPEYANAFKQYADALNQNNTRYNRRYKREAGEIVSLANEKIKGELEKAQKEYKASPETIAKIKKAY
ncbi:MAG TPA: hypothetical protein PKY12_02015, partial [Catalimonadaceae bacterium]|nr:hypothetical protein [Catalimonadaceae bacterium]